MTYLGLRFLKWAAVLLFTIGVAGAVGGGDLASRRTSAYWAATPGFLLMWLAGYALARTTGTSLGSAWMSGGMLLSMLALQAVLWGVEREARPRAAVAAVAIAAMLGAVGLMVWKPGHRASPVVVEAR